MASIINLVDRHTKKPNGCRRLDFVDHHGKEASIYLGKMPQRDAEGVAAKVEAIVTAKGTGRSIPPEVARWIAAEIGDRLAAKLTAKGLIEPRQSAAAVALGPFVAAYIDGRTDVKPRTKLKYRSTETLLLAFYGADRPLAAITPGDADRLRRHCVGLGHVENTVRKHLAVAKLFFGAARRQRLIPESPFADQKTSSRANPSRYYFLSQADAQRVLNKCPDAQWRLLFALSRYGGMRCPSEHLALTWADVDWERSRITVRSSKTEHHEGGGVRQVPIFPELRPYLEEVFNEAEKNLARPPVGTEDVITRYRDSNVNLRTQLKRIIRRAGLEPWPKLFQNLRSTRETELAEVFPMHVVCSWIGNSQNVAKKHYLQTTEEHFARACAPSEKAHRKAHQQPAPMPCNAMQGHRKTRECTGLHSNNPLQVAEAGLEPARPVRDTGF
jgi:integrase